MNHPFFFMGLLLILMHEIDAIRCREWRILPGLSSLDDDLGFKIFIIAHFPLFFFLFYGLVGQQDNESLIWKLDLFFIIHFGLHLLFFKHKNNEFKDWISWTIISGAGFSGFLDLVFFDC